jgi:cyclopropane-fatty-acyl-phospholipid synthase
MNASFYQNLVVKILHKIERGCLILKLPDGSQHFFGNPETGEPIEWTINDIACFKRIALGQDIGLGESYIEGMWEVNDLAAFLRIFIDNGEALKRTRFPIVSAVGKRLLLAWERIGHAMRSNTVEQSERNIHAHYDLGNDFYQTFLDSGMAYSSAFFSGDSDDLEDAQFEKNDRLCRKLSLKPGVHLLEIGSGWGGMALHAAKHYGCKVTSVTISKEQFAMARQRVTEAGLEDQIEIRFQDYRKITGKFDRIVSVEMLEAVGHEHLKTYFEQCSRLLKPNGIFGIQVILSPDSKYKYYRNRVDYIRKHIFPGGHLPSISSIQEQVTKLSDWDLQHFESFGKHYAETLRQWCDRFNETREQRQSLGFDEYFERKWNFYFRYCEAGFDSRHIQVGQFIYCAPNNEDLNTENVLGVLSERARAKAPKANRL